MGMRDEFTLPVKDTLARRVGFRCSNPACHQPTSGPQEDATKAVNIGVAAHVTAASPGGMRYNPQLTAEERTSAQNGIWLCQACAKLVDNDAQRYAVQILQRWKTISEAAALRALEKREADDDELLFLRLEQLMPDLLDAMRKDLQERPLTREFVLLQKNWSYWAGGSEAMYYFEDHPDLESKIRILQYHDLIRDITFTNAKRYVMTEALARYLGA